MPATINDTRGVIYTENFHINPNLTQNKQVLIILKESFTENRGIIFMNSNTLYAQVYFTRIYKYNISKIHIGKILIEKSKVQFLESNKCLDI